MTCLRRSNAPPTHYGTNGGHAMLIYAPTFVTTCPYARLLTYTGTIPVNPSRVRVCESVHGFRRRSSQLEQLLFNCSNPREWSCRSIRSSRRPSAPWPVFQKCIEEAVHDGARPHRPFSIMCITRNCAQQQMRARGETGVRWREAAPAPVFHAYGCE